MKLQYIASKAILNEAIRILRGVREGQTFNAFFYVGITMAAEQVMNGYEEQGIAFYAVATQQKYEDLLQKFE